METKLKDYEILDLVRDLESSFIGIESSRQTLTMMERTRDMRLEQLQKGCLHDSAIECEQNSVRICLVCGIYDLPLQGTYNVLATSEVIERALDAKDFERFCQNHYLLKYIYPLILKDMKSKGLLR